MDTDGALMNPPPDRGALATRTLADGRVIDLWPEIFTYKLTLSRDMKAGDWDDGYEFQSMFVAMRAFEDWNPDEAEPTGWYRHYKTNRRRPDGDPTKEYIAE